MLLRLDKILAEYAQLDPAYGNVGVLIVNALGSGPIDLLETALPARFKLPN